MLRYWWVILAGLGFLPAILLTNVLLDSVTAADWSCSKVEFGASGSQYGGCSTIAGELIVVVAISWIAPLSVLVALLYLLRRDHGGEDDRAIRSETTGRDETAVDWTGIFVRTAAVLVGLANALVIRDPLDVVGSPHGRPLVALFGTLLLAAVAGLLSSEIVLRIGRPALSGGFFARYGITVLGLCLGGAILGGSSIALGLLAGQPGTQSPGGFDPVLLWAALAYGLIAAVVGGVMGSLEGLILALPLAAILGRFRRLRGQGRSASLPGLVVLCLLGVAAIVISVAAPPTAPSGAETASLSDNPPLSCPEYMEEEIGVFDGPGDQETPVFETAGDEWGYQSSSAGPGSLDIRVLDGEGNDVEGFDETLPEDEPLRGGSVSMAEFAFSGAFSLRIDADDDVDYQVLVCD